MGAEILELILLLSHHIGDLNDLIQHIADKPEDIDVQKISDEVRTARAKVAALLAELKEENDG